MNRELYLTLLVFAATVLGVYGFVLVLSPFLLAIAWALCLAAVSYPLYLWLCRKIRRPRLAAFVMVVLTALVILAPLAFLVFIAGEELVDIARDGIPGLRKVPPGVREWVEEHGELFGITDIDELPGQLARAAPSFLLRPVAAGAWQVVGHVFTTVMTLVIMLATQFFVYTEARRLTAWLRGMLPLDDAYTDRIAVTLRQTTSSAVLGGIVVALVQGIMAAIGYSVVGVDAPVLWGIVTCFFALIPFGGAALIWVPIVLILYFTEGGWQPWALLAWGCTAVSGLDNILRPWLLRRTGSRVHPMLLFFAILSGIGLFGMSGIVFGPLLIAVLVTLAEIYREYINRTKTATP